MPSKHAKSIAAKEVATLDEDKRAEVEDLVGDTLMKHVNIKVKASVLKVYTFNQKKQGYFFDYHLYLCYCYPGEIPRNSQRKDDFNIKRFH